MKGIQKVFIPALFLVAATVLSGCGSYGSNTPATTTHVPSAAKRAFLVNRFNNVVHVIDSAKDVPTGATLQVNSSSDSIIVMSNKKSIVHSSNGSLVEFDDAMETLLGTVNSFPGPTESIVPSQDGLFAYAAIPSIGKISKMDLTNQALTTIPADPAAPAPPVLLPGVRHLAITHNGNTILAFSDNTEAVAFVDRTKSDAVTTPLSLAAGSRPYTALFSNDDSTAYILNCGLECGGTVAASIAIVNISNIASPTITSTIPVRAATIAVMDSTNLYVAGSNPTLALGQLDVMNLSTHAVTQVAAPISDGKHTTMALAANNKLYIGSLACSGANGNCLSVYNVSSNTAAVVLATSTNGVPQGDISAITPITGRSVVYVIQNGQLVIYDTSSDQPQATQIFISGRVSDVKEVDN